MEEQEQAGKSVSGVPPGGATRTTSATGTPAPSEPKGSRIKVVAALAVPAVIAVGLYAGSREVHFLGTDESGLVTLYRGLPYELPLGIDLYTEEYTSSVPAQTVRRAPP